MVKITKCPTRKSIPRASDGYQRNPSEPKKKLTRAQKKLLRAQEKAFRQAQFAAR